MEKFEKTVKNNVSEPDIGLLLWQLEEFESFYPMYKTMIKKEWLVD